jgi:hypothetical protein
MKPSSASSTFVDARRSAQRRRSLGGDEAVLTSEPHAYFFLCLSDVIMLTNRFAWVEGRPHLCSHK